MPSFLTLITNISLLFLLQFISLVYTIFYTYYYFCKLPIFVMLLHTNIVCYKKKIYFIFFTNTVLANTQTVIRIWPWLFLDKGRKECFRGRQERIRRTLSQYSSRTYTACARLPVSLIIDQQWIVAPATSMKPAFN